MKKTLVILLNITGINWLFRLLNRNKALILCYHGVCDDNFTLLKGYDERHIPISTFRNQVRFLKEKGYEFATMSTLVDVLKKKQKPRRMAVFTFDDGFCNVVTNAYPVLKEFNAKGCFYVTSGLIGSEDLLWSDLVETVLRNNKKGKFHFIYKNERIAYSLGTKELSERAMQDIIKKLKAVPDHERKELMQQFDATTLNNIPGEFFHASWDQVRSLDKDILEVGSHTVNHPNCENLSTEDGFDEEIGKSKGYIQDEIGYEIEHFNYPSGSFNERVIEHVKKYGYESAVTIIPGFNDSSTDLFRLKRIIPHDNLLLFKAMVSGSFLFIRNCYRKMTGKP